MRKEILFAVIAGVLIGSLGAFGLYRANKAYDIPKPDLLDTNNNQTSTVTKDAEPEITLVISEPLEENLQVTDSVAIKGLSRPDSIIIISAEEEDYLLRADKDGGFEIDVDLIAGLNRLVVAAIDEGGKMTQNTLDVVYSSVFAPIEIQETATDSSDKPDDDEASEDTNPTKVSMGTITDITDNTIQISTNLDKIDLVSVDEENTDFVKSGESIPYEEIAIGDYVIAMGNRGDNEVLQSSRMLVIDKPQDLMRKIFYGNVLEPGRRFITLDFGSGEKISVNTSTDLRVLDGKDEEIEMEDIVEGDVIACSGVIDEGELYARIIQVISSPITETPTIEESIE